MIDLSLGGCMLVKKRLYLICTIIALFFIWETNKAEAANIRIEGSGRYETAVEIAEKGWPAGAETVVLARGDLFPDALAGAPLAKKLNAPILLTTQNKLPSSTKKELINLKTKKVILLGGPQAILSSVETELKGLGVAVERIYGNDRYSTSVAIATKLGASKNEVIVATGKDFPDALAIAPYASEKGVPILISEPASLPYSVGQYVKNAKKAYVIGGTNAISENVKQKLPNSIRIAGNSRYQTAIEIITRFYRDTPNLYISTGTNFADALTGSVLAAKEHTAILLVDKEKLPYETDYLFNRNHVVSYNAFGGRAAVSDDMINLVAKTIEKVNPESMGAGVGERNLLHASLPQISAFVNAEKKVEANGKLSITVKPSIASTFKAGNTYIFPSSPELPSGWIGKIESVNQSTGKVIIVQPAIDEVFKRLSFVKEDNLHLGDIRNISLSEGVSLKISDKKIGNQSEWDNTSPERKNSENTPLIFEVNKTVLSKTHSNGTKNNIVMNGNINVTDAEAKIDTEYNQSSGLSVLELQFNANQKANINFKTNWNGKVTLPTSDISANWETISTNSENQLVLGMVSYEVGTIPIFSANYTEITHIPIGINVTFKANLQGEITTDATFAVSKTSEDQLNVSWNQTKKSFDSSIDSQRTLHTQEIIGAANGSFTYEYGLSPALQIGGLVPVYMHHKELSDTNVQQDGTMSIDLVTSALNDSNGCFKNTVKTNQNTSLITRLKSLNYDSNKGNTTSSLVYQEPYYNQSVDVCENIGAFEGVVTYAKSSEPMPAVTIRAYKNGTLTNKTTSSTNGSYQLDLPEGIYTVTYEKTGFQTEKVEEVTILKNGSNIAPTISLTSLSDLGTGTVNGKIKDAISGTGIENAVIHIRKGYQSSQGEIIQTVTTDRNGQYNLPTLPAGLYSGEVSAEGYIPYTFNIHSKKGATISNQNGILSPVIEEAQTRFVLNWGDQANDLDLHLTGPAMGDERFHLFWDTKQYTEENIVMAQLDGNDSKNSFGHEVATILKQKQGIYRLSVFNYSYRLHEGSTALTNSKARIDVYKGNNYFNTFYIPIETPGKLWTVFEFDGDQFTPIQSVTDGYTFYNQGKYPNVDSLILPSLEKEKE